MITQKHITEVLNWLKNSSHINRTPQAELFKEYQHQPFAKAEMTKTLFGRTLVSQGLARRSFRDPITKRTIKVWGIANLDNRNDKLEYREPRNKPPKYTSCPVCHGTGRISTTTEQDAELLEMAKEIYPDRFKDV